MVPHDCNYCPGLAVTGDSTIHLHQVAQETVLTSLDMPGVKTCFDRVPNTAAFQWQPDAQHQVRNFVYVGCGVIFFATSNSHQPCH